jgi:glyoxylase-like metal-dependent hydrolase (beta-lactamase superfamily II)
MAFLTEPEPQRGVVETILPGVRRVVAANPGRMTYHGTNTYLIDTPEGLVILDPGPEDHQEHVEAVLRATNDQPVKYIFLSHTHHDHFGAIDRLKKATGAPTVGYRISADERFEADIKLDDGDTLAGLHATYTPGHAADHLCFMHTTEDNTKVLFSADHVMSWSSSIVSPPLGDMQAYFHSLELLLDRDEKFYLSGHGPLLPAPRDLVKELYAHRQVREKAIAEELARGGTFDTYTLMNSLYSQTHPNLRRAAERNVLAHLLKLEKEGRAVRVGELWRAA